VYSINLATPNLNHVSLQHRPINLPIEFSLLAQCGMPSMGHYRNHTRGPQRLTRIQQMGVAISQNGGVMPFTLILFKTGKHYLTLNNINTTRGGVVCVC